jgi:hypothetical protein
MNALTRTHAFKCRGGARRRAVTVIMSVSRRLGGEQTSAGLAMCCATACRRAAALHQRFSSPRCDDQVLLHSIQLRNLVYAGVAAVV